MVISHSVELKHYLTHLQSERCLAKLSIRQYRKTMEAAEAWLQAKQLTLLSAGAEDFREYFRERSAGGLASSSLSLIVQVVRGFLEFVKEIGHDRDTIRGQLDAPKQEHQLPVVLNRYQVAALLETPLPANPMYLRDKAILETLYACGLRIGEAITLRVKDVDLKGRSVRVLGKGSKERLIPLGKVAGEAIAKYLAEQRPKLDTKKSEVLFLSCNGKQMVHSVMWELVNRAAKRASITQHVSPHTLRHCFATHLVGGGANLRVVQELLGHTDIGTTQIYVHTDPTRLKAVHAKFHPRG